MKGKYKYFLWINYDNLRTAKSIKLIEERIESVKQYRLKNSSSVAIKGPRTLCKFREIRYKMRST